MDHLGRESKERRGNLVVMDFDGTVQKKDPGLEKEIKREEDSETQENKTKQKTGRE